MTTRTIRILSPILIAVLALPACVDDSKPTPAPAKKDVAPAKSQPAAKKDAAASEKVTPPPAVKDAAPAESTRKEKRLSRMRWVTCATCHGDKGKGDGLAGAALNPKPRNFTDPVLQTKTDEHLFKVIKEGGAAVGLSPQMTANPDLSDGVIWALVEHVRKLGGKKK